MSRKQKFGEKGFVVEMIPGCEDLIQESMDELIKIATRGKTTRFNNLEELGKVLVDIFESDREKYVGLLKAFANTPTVQKFATLPGITTLAQELGVVSPSLVTPPILHVVKDDLILNRGKVFTPAHQDVISTKGSVGQLVLWIPLHTVSADNFGVEAWPGSHLLGALPSANAEFGHTVLEKFIPLTNPDYIEVQKGEALVFSQYLIHRTCSSGQFRLAVSFRFNDAQDKDWAARKFYSAFDRVQNTSKFEDSRELAPKDALEYFQRLCK